MGLLTTYFLNHLEWLPILFLWAAYSVAVFLYYSGTVPKILNFKFLTALTISIRLSYAALLSVLQYYLWSQAEVTRTLVNSPLNDAVPLSDFLRQTFGFVLESKLGYFLFYSWGHFWINALLSITMAFVFYALLRTLKKYNDRFFYEGETELGLLLAVIVGWPNFVAFVPLIFLTVVLVSIFKGLYLKEIYTTLGTPMFLAALIMMVFGSELIGILGLTVLKI